MRENKRLCRRVGMGTVAWTVTIDATEHVAAEGISCSTSRKSAREN